MQTLTRKCNYSKVNDVWKRRRGCLKKDSNESVEKGILDGTLRTTSRKTNRKKGK